MQLAVVGHVEWVQFARVERVPRAGEIIHSLETWEEAAGGGAVAAVQLAKLAGSATLFSSLGNDELGRKARARLALHGVAVRAMAAPSPQRRAFCFLDEAGERTITVLGEKLRPSGGDSRLPWHELAAADGVYFVSGDAEALHAARAARILVATARELPTLQSAGVELDALVGSGEDEGELYHPGALEPPPRVVVTTSGGLGGWSQPGGPFRPAPIPGPVVDAYGCGDSFAAGLTFALSRGDGLQAALELAARCGAAVLTGRGPYTAQLTADELRGAGVNGEPFRCFGADVEIYRDYHDREWGRPVTDEPALLEKLCLEGFQSGLSWLTILRKREAFRRAFAGFQPEVLAGYGAKDVRRLLGDASIVRNRAKIEATIANARATVALRESGATLPELVWRYRPEPRPAPRSFAELQPETPESRALAKELRRAGFRFVGPTTVYATMQACGLVNDHLADCFVREEVEAEQSRIKLPSAAD